MATLNVGARLGPYEVLGSLGAGGMGEVYRARDTRLGREVAIKCVSKELSGDSSSRARIEREARSVAALAHPNICPLHDVGTHDGSTYLVMELLDGETLASRLARTRGGMSFGDALAIAAQIADALAYAHRHGIVHRDLKPANIMLTPTGARLLDFGLAKPRERDAMTGDTKTQSLITRQHEVIGTLAYMAPEQLEGRADERSDIFALGAVLFEMLTGSRAFAGDSSPAVIAAIVSHEPPPIETLRPDTPAAVARIAKRCLAKNPDRRWQSAADLAEELRWSATEPSSGARSVATTRRPTRLFASLAFIAAVVAIVLTVGWSWRTAVPTTATHLGFVAPRGVEFPGFNTGLAASPDGSTVAFAATIGTGSGATTHLFVKRLDAPEVQLIAGSDEALYPFFSPDGQAIAFFAQRKLKVWSASSGSISVVADLAGFINGLTASWGSDGAILFGENSDLANHGISRVAATGGAIDSITQVDTARGEVFHFGAQRLENGSILFTRRKNGPNGIEFDLAARTNSGDIVTVLPGVSLATYIGERRMVYQVGSTLSLAAFDPATLAVSDARPLVDGVLPTTSGASWSIGGDVLVYRSVDPPRRRLVWVDRSGASVPLGLPVRDYSTPRISPDGDRIGMSIQESTGNSMWLGSLRQQTLTQVSQGRGVGGVVWTADGSRIFSSRTKGSAREVIVQPSDGSGSPRVILDTDEQLFVADISPDQRTLVVMKPTNGNRDIWVMDLDGGGLRPIVQQPGTEYGGRVSPDGKWMSYFSQNDAVASNHSELFVTPFPNGGPRWQISRDGARESVWSLDGSELFYRNLDQMVSVRIKPGARFDWEPPRVLFSGAYLAQGGPGSVQYDVAADGRFLMIEEAPLGSPTVNVVLGWQRLAR